MTHLCHAALRPASVLSQTSQADLTKVHSVHCEKPKSVDVSRLAKTVPDIVTHQELTIAMEVSVRKLPR